MTPRQDGGLYVGSAYQCLPSFFTILFYIRTVWFTELCVFTISVILTLRQVPGSLMVRSQHLLS